MTALPGKEADNVYTPGVTTTMLTQIGLYHPSGGVGSVNRSRVMNRLIFIDTSSA